MYLPGSFLSALALMLLGMVCWGSWANPYKLTRNWRFDLFYIDFALGVFVVSALAAGTLGTFFGQPTFAENLLGSDSGSRTFALLAGVVLNCGNVLLIAGMAMVGMATAFPIGVGISFVLGTVISYLIMPRGDPKLLFPGVALVLLAVVVNAWAYRAAAKTREAVSRRGLAVCAAAGFLLAGFGPLVARAMSTSRPLSPYGVAFLFTAGALLSTFPLVWWMLRHPVSGEPGAFSQYWGGSLAEHAAGWSAGVIWGCGTVAAFIAADFVGVALACAIGQTNPLIAALWGVFVWREFRGAASKAIRLLVMMFALYLSGIALLVLSFR